MTKLQEIVNYYFLIKEELDEEEVKEKSKSGEIEYARYVKPAHDFLELCEGDLDRAKFLLLKVAEKADKNGLEDWGLEYALSQYLEIVNNYEIK